MPVLPSKPLDFGLVQAPQLAGQASGGPAAGLGEALAALGGGQTPIQAEPLDPRMQRDMRMDAIFNNQAQAPAIQMPDAGYEGVSRAQDRFNEMLQQYPGANPGVLQAIASSMVALQDPRLAMNIIQQPSADLVNWQQQIEPLEAAAREERYMNQQNRLAQGQRDRLELGRARQALQEFKARNPNYKFQKSGDEWVAFDPQNPGAPIPTGVKTGDLTPLEEMELFQQQQDIRQAGRMEAIGARGDIQRDLQEERFGQQSRLQEQRGSQAAQMQAERLAAGGGSRTQSAADRRKEIENNAQQAINDNPEWADFITFDSSGRVQVAPAGESGGFLGMGGVTLDPDTREEILATIYGSAPTGPPPQTTTSTVQAPVTEAPPPGRVFVFSPDGARHSVPIEQLDQALEAGYTEVP